jgi:thiol-disulfide isomerase/thioredoxin
LKKDSIIIAGPKSTGFEIQYEIRKCENQFISNGKFPHFESATLEKNFLAIDSVADRQNSLLNQNKKKISKDLYDLLRTHIYAVWDWTEYDELIYFGMAYADSSANPIMDSYRNYLLKYKAPRVNPNPMSDRCGFYIKYLYDKYRVDSCLTINRKFQVTNCLNFFAKKYSGLLREQLFACVITETKQYPRELREVIDRELVSMKNSDYRQFLNSVDDTRIEGAPAYNFTLNDIHDKIVQLKDFRGQVVVLDFWFTGCINCKELAPYMAMIEKEFKNMPVKFISVSTDRNKNQWLSSVGDGSYTSPEIDNLYTGGEGIKNAALKKYHVDAFPALVIVNKDGKVVNVNIDPRNDNGDALKKQINDCLK